MNLLATGPVYRSKGATAGLLRDRFANEVVTPANSLRLLPNVLLPAMDDDKCVPETARAAAAVAMAAKGQILQLQDRRPVLPLRHQPLQACQGILLCCSHSAETSKVNLQSLPLSPSLQ